MRRKVRKRKPKDVFDDVDEDEECKSLHGSATGVTISSAKRTLLEKRTIDLKDCLPQEPIEKYLADADLEEHKAYDNQAEGERHV